MPPRFLAGKSSVDGAAGRMSQNHYEADPEMQDCILDTAHPDPVQDIARGSDDEEITDTLIEKDLGWNTRIGATDDYGEWILSIFDLGSPLLIPAGVNGSSLCIPHVTIEKSLYPRFHTIPFLDPSA